MQKYVAEDDTEFLCHYGVKGMKWRVKGSNSSANSIEYYGKKGDPNLPLNKQLKDQEDKKNAAGKIINRSKIAINNAKKKKQAQDALDKFKKKFNRPKLKIGTSYINGKLVDKKK